MKQIFALKSLRLEDLKIGGMIALPAVSLSILVTGWRLGSLIGLTIIGIVATARRAYINVLKARATEPSRVWVDVLVNEIKVGEISEADVKRIELATFECVYNYTAQLVEFGRLLIRAGAGVLSAVPTTVFWCAVLIGLFAPQVYVDAVAPTPAWTAETVGELVDLAIKVLLLAVVVIRIARFALFGSFNEFYNFFAEDTARQIRRKLGVAGNGCVLLVRRHDGVLS